MNQTKHTEPAIFESLLRQIVRAEIRAALAEMGASEIQPPLEAPASPIVLTVDQVSALIGVAVQTLY